MAKSAAPLLATAGIIALLALSNKKSSSKGDSTGQKPVEPPPGEGLQFYEYVTPGADPASELPMVLVFHSRSTPESSLDSKGRRWAETNISGPARIIVPVSPKTLQSGNLSWFDKAAATADQQALSDEMAEMGNRVADFIRQIIRVRPTTGKPLVIGSSQGGSMSYLLASMAPNDIRGAVAVSGWLPEQLWTPQMAPTIAYHGDADTIVPYDATLRYWQALGGIAPMATASFEVDPDKTHGHYLSSDMSRQMIRATNYLLGYRDTPPAGVSPQGVA